ncbi:hypothetical protein ACPOL_1377 [Acidisarcina polymorpha]|uniref:Uncharacterized protein n=1 Tax=Acidisarcina polymorpha TaxID=2211140 RepID=A0A2Z5FWF9_9BACT|nr:hypothetical protein ACPOL_1377 [Acidisarcina polymorpha]
MAGSQLYRHRNSIGALWYASIMTIGFFALEVTQARVR